MESIKIFEESKVRTIWDEHEEKWFVSIIDVVFILVQSKDYLTDMSTLYHTNHLIF